MADNPRHEREGSDGQDAPGPERGIEGSGVGGGSSPPEKLLEAKEVVERILRLLDVRAEVRVHDAPEAIACRIDVEEGSALFEGGNGRQVVESIQFLANRIVHREGEGRKWIVLTPGEDLEEAEEAIAGMARRLASSVQRMKEPLTLVGMDARKRRIVHLALAEEAGIQTRSEGDGALRRIVIEAKEQ